MRDKHKYLPQIPIKIIQSILKERKLEDPEITDLIELYFKKKRGYCLKMPAPKSNVISLTSGGLDTTIVTAILLNEFGLKVIPVYFKRSIKNSPKAQKSIEFFNSYFLKKYPDLYLNSASISLTVPSEEISKILSLTHASTKGTKPGSNQERGIPFQPSLYAYYSLQYCQYLEETENMKIRSIFGAWLPENGKSYAYETLTAMRMVMFELCVLTADFTWQFISLPIEKEFGFFFGKNVLVKWGSENGIPMEKTWSCSFAGLFHCGQCGNCIDRRISFMNADVEDKTKYIKYLPLKLKIK